MMDISNLDIVPYPHPALRWVAKEVPKITPLIKDVCKKMVEIMHDYKGMGLAATQIAVPWRIFVASVGEKDLIFINPRVHLGKNERDRNPRMVEDTEACLSFPGLRPSGKIKRSRDVYVKAQDVEGKSFAMSGGGMFARVIQHENDHLDGVLFIDHLLKEETEDWCEYLTTQYDFMVNRFAVPKYGDDEAEKQKLLNLEKILYDKTDQRVQS